VDVWLVDVQDSFELSYAWVVEAGITLPVLLDGEGSAYWSYDHGEAGLVSAPYPVHVVVDGEGVIRLFSRESELDLVIDAVQAALEAL